jgi:AcrR family transcriptional regulator
MARPTSFTNEYLLSAARAVFLERGFQATTAEVARRAGVAEGTLFYRFKSKAKLFREALKEELQEPEWLRGLSERVGKGEVADTLSALGEEILAHMRNAVPVQLLEWLSPAGPPGKRSTSPSEPVPVRTVRQLATFFEAEMRAGRLHRRDPELTARLFLGGLLHYAWHENILKVQQPPLRPSKQYVREVVELLLAGLHPSGAHPAPRAGATEAGAAPRR